LVVVPNMNTIRKKCEIYKLIFFDLTVDLVRQKNT